jgi:hypothetical protein
MWLINNETLTVEPFTDESSVPYAILSHTWEEEVTFQDMKNLDSARQKRGFIKIQRICYTVPFSGTARTSNRIQLSYLFKPDVVIGILKDLLLLTLRTLKVTSLLPISKY